MGLEALTLTQLSKLFASKGLSPVEYIKSVIAQAELKKDLNTIVTLDETLALKNAGASEKRYMSGTQISPLDGIPIAIKDIIDTKDIVTTYGCRAYSDHLPEKDAFVVKKLRNAGANISIKSNTSQFALGPTGEVSYGGAVKNARNPDYTTGGSSSGSASAVAGRIVPAALGSDSGGSIRVPSSICGTVGIKPTFSLVSNEGVMPVSETVDCVGPITRTVEDGAMLLQAIAGYNIGDWRSSPVPYTDYSSRLTESIAGSKAVVVSNLFDGAVMPEVVSGCLNAVAVLSSLGMSIEDKKLKSTDELRTAHQIGMLAMAHAYHLKDIELYRDDIYDEVYQRLISGNIISDLYVEYEMRKNEMRSMLLELMGNADCLIYPTTPLTACKLGEGKKMLKINGIETSSYSSNGSITWASSFACTPCVNIPVAFTPSGLPVGLSIMGRPFDEANILRIAKNLLDALGLEL